MMVDSLQIMKNIMTCTLLGLLCVCVCTVYYPDFLILIIL